MDLKAHRIHFPGALIAGDLAEIFGRRPTIIAGASIPARPLLDERELKLFFLAGCIIYSIGVILQAASHGLGLIVAGRLIAGFGVGFVSASKAFSLTSRRAFTADPSHSVIILYMSEIAPKKVRGTLVSGYQQAVTLGMYFAALPLPSSKPVANDVLQDFSLLPVSPTLPKTAPTLAPVRFASLSAVAPRTDLACLHRPHSDLHPVPLGTYPRHWTYLLAREPPLLRPPR